VLSHFTDHGIWKKQSRSRGDNPQATGPTRRQLENPVTLFWSLPKRNEWIGTLLAHVMAYSHLNFIRDFAVPRFNAQHSACVMTLGNQDLKFCYGPEKFSEIINAFAAVRVLCFHRIIDWRLVLISDLPLMLLDPVCTRFHPLSCVVWSDLCSLIQGRLRT
jgi:hypothetical protein